MADIYVSPSGNDTTGTGGQLTPYRTIGKAVTVAVPSTQILLYDGVWQESVVTADSDLTIKPAPGAHPILDGGGILDFAFFVPQTKLRNRIEGLEIRNYRIQGVFLFGAKGENSGHVVTRNHIHHIIGVTPYVASYGIQSSYGNPVISDNEIHHIGHAIECEGIWIGYCNNATVDGNVVYCARKDGIRDYMGLNNTIRNNRVFWCWAGIDLNEAAGALVANNYIYWNVENFQPKHTNDPWQPNPFDPSEANGYSVLNYWGLEDGEVEWCRFWHNTCYGAAYAHIRFAINDNLSGGSDGLMHQLDVRDNIFAGPSFDRLWNAPEAATSSVIVDHNFYTSVHTPTNFYQTGYDTFTGGKTLAQMRADPGWELNGRVDDPMFIDVANANFDLDAASPARAGGVALAGPIFGVPSPYGSQVGARGLSTPRVVPRFHPATVLTSKSAGLGTPRSYIADGFKFTYFLANSATEEWAVIDYGVPVSIDDFFIDVFGHGSALNVREYRFEVGDSSTGPWTVVRAGTTPDEAENPTFVEMIPPVLTRYVRFTAVSNYGEPSTVAISDVRAGQLADSLIDPPPEPVGPVVTMAPARDVGETTVTFDGTVDPEGVSTSARFEYGLTTAYGTQASAVAMGSGSTAVAISQDITGLEPGTLYHFRLTATSAAGTSVTSDGTFSTLVAPLVGAASGYWGARAA